MDRLSPKEIVRHWKVYPKLAGKVQIPQTCLRGFLKLRTAPSTAQVRNTSTAGPEKHRSFEDGGWSALRLETRFILPRPSCYNRS